MNWERRQTTIESYEGRLTNRAFHDFVFPSLEEFRFESVYLSPVVFVSSLCISEYFQCFFRLREYYYCKNVFYEVCFPLRRLSRDFVFFHEIKIVIILFHPFSPTETCCIAPALIANIYRFY